MAVTKTNFINYIRCPRYVALEKLKKDNLNANISIEEYKKEELFVQKQELLATMFDAEGNDLIDIENKQLEIMMPYYKEVEIFAGKKVDHTFEGKAKYSKETYNQEPFFTIIDNIKYLCYVDIYNQRKEGFDIIEVKATTTKKFLNIGKTKTINEKKELFSIFIKDQKGILRLREDLPNSFDENLTKKDYLKHKAKLYDKYNPVGHYIYDLAVQRFIIESQLKSQGKINQLKNVKYYLAVLNSEYSYNGKEHNDNIIAFIDLTNVTKDYYDKIKNDIKRVNEYIANVDATKCSVGIHCELKKTTKCKFTNICFNLPKKYSILTYQNNHFGFKTEEGENFNRYDLINEGKTKMLDINERLLQRKANIIQREAVANNKVYLDKEKIQSGIETIIYPIYHLDFETFPCPIPRFSGETPYTQSVFQFSLHIERKPGICHEDKDHYEYLAPNHNDNREELIKKMCQLIDTDKPGTIMVYNQAFEKTRLKELRTIFPLYKSKLDKMITMLFDLMYLVKTNAKFYVALGFNEERSKLFNYYHKDLNGSFSIKKVLPLFSNLNYINLEVGNGMDALITYASFNNLSKKDYIQKYNALIKYCKQDTYAMVEILKGLRKLIK